MKSQDPGRAALVERVSKRLEAGETRDPKTGRPLELAEEDRPVELEPGDHFWVDLASQMTGAIPPDGTFPVPSEEDRVLERLGVHHPANQAFAREMLRAYWAGRADGLSTRFEKPKKPPKKGRSR